MIETQNMIKYKEHRLIEKAIKLRKKEGIPQETVAAIITMLQHTIMRQSCDKFMFCIVLYGCGIINVKEAKKEYEDD